MSQRQRFRITDFSGGLNPDQHPLDIQPNQAEEILNLRLDQVGSLKTRRGFSRLITEAYGSPIRAIGRWKDPAASPVRNDILIKAANGSIELADPTLNTYTSLYSGLSASADGDFYSAQDVTVYFNGVDMPIFYDGTGFKTIGLTGPAAVPTLTVSGTGLTGTYQYAYTYYDEDTGSDSNPSPSASITVTNEGVSVGYTASGSPRVSHIRIWRTSDGGATFRLLHQVPNATSSWVDNGSLVLSPLIELRFDRFPPPVAFDNMAYVKGFWFGSKGRTVYWTRALSLDAWSPLRSTDVPFEGNDIITALWAFRDTLLVFGKRNIVLVAGSAGPDAQGLFQFIREDVEMGVCTRRSITEADGNLVFLSFSGLRVFPGYQPVAAQIDRTLATSTCSPASSASLIYVPEERALWVAIPGAGRVFTIHTANEAVSRYNLNGQRFLQGGRTGFDRPLFVQGGWINEYGATNDVGEAIPFAWRSKVFALENPEHVKFFRRIGAYASTGSVSTVTVTISDSGYTYPVLLESTGESTLTLWDEFDWAYDEGEEPVGWVNAVWSSQGVSYFIGALPANTLIGRTMQVSITGDASTETEVVAPISMDYRESDRFLGR